MLDSVMNTTNAGAVGLALDEQVQLRQVACALVLDSCLLHFFAVDEEGK